jgi:DNA-binding transcriptional LysR family regulator
MTLTQLRTFLAVAETGSVRAAAAQLVVTQSAVSSCLAALQKDLGLTLVSKDGRGLRLTGAGEIYAGYVRGVLGLLDEAHTAAVGEAEGGRLRIAAVTTAGEQLLPRLLATFRRSHPRIGLLLEVGNRARVWSLVADHEVDLVLGGRPPRGPGRPGMVTHALRPNPLIVVCAAAAAKALLPRGVSPRDAPAAGGAAPAAAVEDVLPRGVSRDLPAAAGAAPAAAVEDMLPEDAAGDAPLVLSWLAGQTWLLREHGSGTRATTESFLESLELTPGTLTVGSNVAVCESVAAGLGVTLISRDAVARDLGRGALVELPTPATPLRRDWCLVSRAGPLPAPARLFVQHVLDTGEFHALPRPSGGPPKADGA